MVAEISEIRNSFWWNVRYFQPLLQKYQLLLTVILDFRNVWYRCGRFSLHISANQ